MYLSNNVYIVPFDMHAKSCLAYGQQLLGSVVFWYELSFLDLRGFSIYLEPWHDDIFEFLDLGKNHGKVLLSTVTYIIFPFTFMVSYENFAIYFYKKASHFYVKSAVYFYPKLLVLIYQLLFLLAGRMLGSRSILCFLVFLIFLWKRFKVTENGPCFVLLKLLV